MSTQADNTPKKFTSKFFRVATEGATTDGRQIQREWIEQMAASYSPAKYGARVWMEHIRGISPDSQFRAYGDVIELEAREVEDKKLALFAKIDPIPELVALTKSRQKIYTSIEIELKFADTQQAYLVGLGVTDSPASLGTEVLAFAAQNPQSSPFSARKLHPENLFSACLETGIEFEQLEPAGGGLMDKVRAALKKFSSTERAASAADREELGNAVIAVAEDLALLHTTNKDRDDKIESLNRQLEEMKRDFSGMNDRLDTTPNDYRQRPAATGGTGKVLTDC